MCQLIRIEVRKYEVNQLSALPAIPILTNRNRRRLWSIVSNDALRSSRTRIIQYVLLSSHKIFVFNMVISVSVDLFGT